MNFDWILLGVLFAIMLLYTVIAVLKHTYVKSALMLGSVLMAFLISLLLQVFGLYKLIASPIASLIKIGLPIDSADAIGLINAAISSIISTVLFVVFFVIFFILLRFIAVPLISKAIKHKKKKDESAGMTVVSGVCGALTGFLLFGVMLMPMFYLLGFVDSAFAVTRGEQEYNDSQIYATLDVIDKDTVEPLENGIVMSAYKYTGVSAAMRGTAGLGGSFVLSNGEKVNVADTLNNVLENVLPVVVNFQSGKVEDSVVSENLKALFNDPVILSVAADFAKTGLSNLGKADGAEAEEAAEAEKASSLTGLLTVISDNYRNADKSVIVNDIKSFSNAIIYLNDQNLISEFFDKNESAAAFSYMLSDREVLTETVKCIAATSVFTDVISSFYEQELGVLNNMLGIPANAAEAGNNTDVTIEMILNNTHFNDWTEETKAADVEALVEVVHNIITVSNDLGGLNTEDSNYISYLAKHLGTIGRTIDIMKNTHCMCDVAPLLFDGLIQNENIKNFVPAEKIKSYKEQIENDPSVTYEGVMGSLGSAIVIASAIGGNK